MSENQITRIDFLRRIGTAGFAAAAVVGLTTSQSSITPESKPKESGIIQTGIREIEVDGKKYQIKVNPQSVKDVILAQTQQAAYLGPDAHHKTQQWLENNILEFQVFDFTTNPFISLNPAVESYFTPPEINFLSHRAVIAIRASMLPELVRFNLVRATNINLALEPLLVLSHEADNLASYIDSPEVWQKNADLINAFYKKNFLLQGLDGLFFMAGLKLLRNGRLDMKRAKSLLGATITVTTALNFCSNIVSLISATSILLNRGLSPDVLYHDIRNDKITESRLKSDFKYRNLALGMLEFTPK